MKTQDKTEIKTRILEIRNRYMRLRNICGPQNISKNTIADYIREIQSLESQLK